jgi:Family of unknown function (DUF5763)
MAQCAGTTQRGDRCKRDAREGSGFCAIHQDQEVRPRADRSVEWDRDSVVKAAIGCALVVAIVFFRIRR